MKKTGMLALPTMLAVAVLICTGCNGLSSQDSSYYTADKCYAYNQLDRDDQKVYKKIEKAMKSFDETVRIPGSHNHGEVVKIEQYVLDDFPEIFWVKNQLSYCRNENTGDVTRLNLSYLYTEDEAQELMSQIETVRDSVISTIDKNAESGDKVLDVYEYIITNTDYDSDTYVQYEAGNENPADAESGSGIVGCLLNKKALCQGYSKTFQYLANSLGFETAYVKGTAGGESHGWSMVLIDGDWYNVDTTWGDPISRGNHKSEISYDYFCVTDRELGRTHKVDFGEFGMKLPKCTATKWNYYSLKGLLFDSYSRKNVNRAIDFALNEKNDYISMKFTSETAYRDAVRELFTNREIFDILNDREGMSTHQISHICSDDMYTVKIFY